MRALARNIISRVPFKQPLFSMLRPLRPPERVYRHLHFRGVIDVEPGPGARFRIHHWGNQVENDLFWSPFGRGWEGGSLRIWAALARNAEYIADVGANTGVYALSAAALSPRARVLAVEPVERIFQRLRRNVELNGYDIALDERAASSANGTAILHDTDGPHSYSASLEPEMLGSAATRKVGIRTARLDDILAAHGFPRLDLIKIDVERHEPEALAGMAETLKKDRPALLIEVLDGDIGAAIERHVDGLGYSFFHIDDEAGRAEPAQHLSGDGSGRNYLLCLEPAATALRAQGLILA